MSNNKHESPKIHILDNHTANRIAAGEVVERPASVVKELVENSIDAGATQIEVRVYNQEHTKIKVTDNGCGMGPEDMRLAVLRHATSKINNAADLEHLTTLGFRGEALPSIASVSHLTITSKTADSAVGYTMTVEGGKAALPVEAAARNGTTVLVDRLFFNAPARKKFLKSPRTEAGLISDIICELVVAHADIAFTLRHGNHRSVVSSGNGDLSQAMVSAYGRDAAENFLQVESDDGLVRGLVSLPSIHRSTRNGYHFIINGRAVRCQELYAAVEEGYYTCLPAQRYPLVFLFLSLPPETVDVNVHPSKLEIKLREPRLVREAVTLAIRNGLLKSQLLIPQVKHQVLPRDRVDVLPPASGTSIKKGKNQPPGLMAAPVVAERKKMTQADFYQALYQGIAPEQDTAPLPRQQEGALPEAPLADVEKFIVDTSLPEPQNKITYSAMQLIGQYLGTFIIASYGRDIYIIDQHAAAERVLYEKIASQASASQSESAMLAVPVNLNLSYKEHLLLTEYLLQLRDFGFIIEYFGDTTYIIRGVPTWYGDATQADTLLLTLLEDLQAGRGGLIRLRREELFKAACKKAVKANKYLSNQDISALFTALDQCENSITCPHGRPIAIKLTENEIRKRFLRSSI